VPTDEDCITLSFDNIVGHTAQHDLARQLQPKLASIKQAAPNLIIKVLIPEDLNEVYVTFENIGPIEQRLKFEKFLHKWLGKLELK
jgi:hypothetical protein